MVILLVIILILILGFIIFRLFKRKKQDTLLMFTGTNGSGKTLNGVDLVQKFYNKSYKEYRKKIKKIAPLEIPKVYSNFPIWYKCKGKWVLSEKLTFEMCILHEKINQGSIVVIDELGSFISQFDFKGKNVELFDEFCRLFRHYFGNTSHLICMDQCSNNAVLQVRRRFSKVFNCVQTRFWLNGLFHITRYRNVSISEEIKTIEEIEKGDADTDENINKIISFHIPKIIKKILHIRNKYDDRAYSNRYIDVYAKELHSDSVLKQNDLLRFDFKHLYKNILESEENKENE